MPNDLLDVALEGCMGSYSWTTDNSLLNIDLFAHIPEYPLQDGSKSYR